MQRELSLFVGELFSFSSYPPDPVSVASGAHSRFVLDTQVTGNPWSLQARLFLIPSLFFLFFRCFASFAAVASATTHYTSFVCCLPACNNSLISNSGDLIYCRQMDALNFKSYLASLCTCGVLPSVIKFHSSSVMYETLSLGKY